MKFALFLSVLLFAGTAHSETLPVPVLSIEAITKNAPPRVGAFSHGEAKLTFQSAIPVACSVIYGETVRYGHIAVDADMDGGAHSNHHPTLANLKPDTLYHYRVQGTASDGRLFASRDMTFRTPPAAINKRVNLLSLGAGAKVIAVSSNYGGSNAGAWGIHGALDGKRSTEWSSRGDGDKAFVEIALAKASKLTSVSVWTRTMSDGTAQISRFTVTTDRGKVFGPFALKDASKPYEFKINATAKSLRLDVVKSSGGNTGLVAFAAYGAPIR
jgi:hypothetical protein